LKKKTTGLLLILLFAGSLQSAEINTAGKIFLLETGARSLYLAGCGTLLGEAVSGLYNPAAQVFTPDVTGSVYLNPRPKIGYNHDFWAVSFGAHSEFGALGFYYLTRDGLEDSFYPPEEASALILAGKPSKKINLTLGLALKILITQPQRTAFIPLDQPISKTYKMAFDLGAAFKGILPKASFGNNRYDPSDIRIAPENQFTQGFSVALTLQNMGGSVEYENSIEKLMLPQTFRADLLWGGYHDRRFDVIIAIQVQKLLVSRKKSSNPEYEAGGYNSATDALFNAWGGGDLEGGWTARLGGEVSAFDRISAGIGWSKDYKTRRSFIYTGIGLGTEWLRLYVTREHEPDGDADLADELRWELSVRLSYRQIRDWISGNDY
jgi:hypothetical protein